MSAGTKYDGGPFAPTIRAQVVGSIAVTETLEPGASMRDYFAAMAMQPLIRCVQNYGKHPSETDDDWTWISKRAFAMADAMLAERAK